MEPQQLQSGGMPPEIEAELDEAITRLSPKDRSAIVLHFLENLMLTWLNMDSEAALTAMMENRSDEHQKRPLH